MYIPRNRTFWSVGLGHFTNDSFMSMGVVLLTFLSSSVLPMTNTQIGLAVSLKQIAGAVSQPWFGMRADRTGGRWIGAGGLLWVIVTFLLALVLAVLTRSYLLMLIPFVLQGVGSGALHPVGALHAAESDDKRAASSMAYFFLLGQSGLALGPTLIGVLLDAANQGSLLQYSGLLAFPGRGLMSANVSPVFVLGLIALPLVMFMLTGIPRERVRKGRPERTERTSASLSQRWKALLPFLLIALMVLLRSLAQPGSVNFIPVLFEQKGWSAAQYGLITSFFWLASGISGVVFGNLADRYDRRLVVMASMVLSAPAFFFLPVLDGAGAFVLAVLAGGLSGGAHSIIVVLAQELMPHSKGLASGAILGFIFGAGAMGSLAIGVISDAIGLPATFQIVAAVAAIAGMMGLLLPKNRTVAVEMA